MMASASAFDGAPSASAFDGAPSASAFDGAPSASAFDGALSALQVSSGGGVFDGFDLFPSSASPAQVSARAAALVEAARAPTPKRKTPDERAESRKRRKRSPPPPPDDDDDDDDSTPPPPSCSSPPRTPPLLAKSPFELTPNEANARYRGWLRGRYRLTHVLGAGAYGRVYRAVDAEGNTVAVKHVPAVFRDPVDAKRALREVRVLRALRHPALVRLVETLAPPPHLTASFSELFIVLEAADTNLHAILYGPTKQQFKTLHLQYIMRQLFQALDALHSAGVVHRDVKPGNILVNRDTSVRLCDFGLARGLAHALPAPRAAQSAPAPAPPRLTAHVVTRWYRAPELMLGRAYTAAIDVWSAGCVLAELLDMQREPDPARRTGALFPGATCWPLSPHARGGEREDQLNVIFGRLGVPRGVTREAYPALQRHAPPQGLAARFPRADARAVDLLQRLLALDARDRPTARQALQHAFFDDVRDELPASGAPAAAVAFPFEREALDTERLRALFLEEMSA